MKYVLDVVYLLAALVVSPKLIYRMVRQNRYRTGWAERLGRINFTPSGKKRIWLHAVSVGEINAARTLIDGLQQALPDYEVVVSSTTDTGLARARALYDQRLPVFFFPLDFSFAMQRAFENIQPAICLLMELEVWPNLVLTASRLGIPVVVVNGRLSDTSYPKYRLIRPVAAWIFKKVTLVLAQTEQYARRFQALGCPKAKVIVTGSLKYDTAQVADKVAGADELARQLDLADEPLWVAGGTGPGEENIILEVFRKLKQQKELANLRLAVVPRKPERFDEVAELIEQSGFEFVRYSQVKQQEPAYRVAGRLDFVAVTPDTGPQKARRGIDKAAVILGDTMGDLRKFYSLARVIFVGRSLVPMGGSDMMEAAALGKCVIFGPHAFNFKQAVDALLADNGAVMVKDKDELLAAVQKCLLEPAYADNLARNGREVIRKNQGATARTIKQIAAFLNG
jgi:3-deoxy-D-manno-octulosonic-acid transferase